MSRLQCPLLDVQREVSDGDWVFIILVATSAWLAEPFSRERVQVEVGPVADTRFEDDLGRSARRDMLYIYFKTGVPKPPAIEVDTVMEILCVSDQIADF